MFVILSDEIIRLCRRLLLARGCTLLARLRRRLAIILDLTCLFTSTSTRLGDGLSLASVLLFLLAAQLRKMSFTLPLFFVELSKFVALRLLISKRVLELLRGLLQQRHVGVLCTLLDDLVGDVQKLFALRGIDECLQQRLGLLNPLDGRAQILRGALLDGHVVQHLERFV